MLTNIGNLEESLRHSLKALQNLRVLRDRTYYQVDLELSHLFDRQEMQLQKSIANLTVVVNSLKDEFLNTLD